MLLKSVLKTNGEAMQVAHFILVDSLAVVL